MPRTPKIGLDFVGWKTDIFENDTKIDELLDAQGWIGFSIYFYLCMKAYASDGYFYRWSYANAATTARRMGGGIGSDAVIQTVKVCLRVGLFDKNLLDVGILTSKGIQRRYLKAIEKRTYKIVDHNIWLLDEAETKGSGIIFEKEKSSGSLDFCAENKDFLPENADFLPENAHNSKVKYSKEYIDNKKNNNTSVRTIEKKPVLTMLLKNGDEYPVFQDDIDEWEKSFPSVDVPQQLKAMRIWCRDNPSKRKTQAGIRRFISGWLIKEQDNARPPTEKKPSRPPDYMSYHREMTPEEYAEFRKQWGHDDGPR